MTYYTYATNKDVAIVSRNLRDADYMEAAYATGNDPVECVLSSYRRSKICYAIRNGSVPIGVFGIAPGHHGHGFVWMVGTKQMDRGWFSIGAASKEIINTLAAPLDFLSNHVWEGNTEHIKWLSWMGAKFGESKPHGPFGKPFREFTYVYRDRNNGRRCGSGGGIGGGSSGC